MVGGDSSKPVGRKTFSLKKGVGGGGKFLVPKEFVKMTISIIQSFAKKFSSKQP